MTFQAFRRIGFLITAELDPRSADPLQLCAHIADQPTSLLAFLAVAPIAAIGCSATESKRQTELLKVIARKGSRADSHQGQTGSKNDLKSGAWAFRKRIKVIPGVYINLSKSGISANTGVRGASLTFESDGVYRNLGLQRPHFGGS